METVSVLDRLDDVIASRRDSSEGFFFFNRRPSTGGFIGITERMESRECKDSIPKRLGTFAGYKPIVVHVGRVLITAPIRFDRGKYTSERRRKYTATVDETQMYNRV